MARVGHLREVLSVYSLVASVCSKARAGPRPRRIPPGMTRLGAGIESGHTGSLSATGPPAEGLGAGMEGQGWAWINIPGNPFKNNIYLFIISDRGRDESVLP